ncbi:MAG: sigma-70 family RNA polymerase sigma factor [Acidobacteria bacterium]|nr:sigma-70 family RNA polymerase sigma factor [Acidobacteriota bacterium]
MLEAALPISDLELAHASAAGDEAAFEQIYRAHFRRVYSLCVRMLGNPTEAEDVTQDVFVQLHRKIGTFQGDAALSTWLYRLTVNTVLMHLRHKQRKHKEQLLEDDSLQSLAEMSQVAHRDEVSPIDRIALERAITQLPTGYRNVLVLHDIEGYEHEEIAEMLGISAGTSKSQLHKARVKMRKLLLGNRPAKRSLELKFKTS